MGGQGLCSVTADQNKILITTSQAAKHYLRYNMPQTSVICFESYVLLMEAHLYG